MSNYKDINIPHNCTHVKIDIGLSYSAPIANKWLLKEPNLFVLGFEPNTICCSMIQNNTMPSTPFPDFNLEKRFLDQGRFQLFQYALNDVDKESISNFYINKRDYGTSSLYTHNQTTLGQIEQVHEVPVISLKMIFDNFPWDRFEYIDYIKIDAQGSDLNILKSAKEYLKERVVYVTAEPDGIYYQGAEDCTEINMDEYMKSQNFIRIEHINTRDPTYLNEKFMHLKDKIWIHQCGNWPC
jgi:FkbM family methyltransferase